MWILSSGSFALVPISLNPKPNSIFFFPLTISPFFHLHPNMKSSILVRSFPSFSIYDTSFPTSNTRNQLSFPRRIFNCPAQNDESFSLRVVSPTLLTAEKEEAKAVLNLFLKKLGLNKIVASRTINKADLFVDHLLSVLHSVHKARYLVGRELTTLEIRNALIPYLESLLKEHGVFVVDLVENFPNPPGEKKMEEIEQKEPVLDESSAPVSPTSSILDTTKQRKILTRANEIISSGKLPPHILYLMDLGMDVEMIRQILKRFPAFAYYTLDGKIKPVVEFLLDLGIPKSDIPIILSKRPQLCGISLTNNLIPTMHFLEELGMDKKQWAKIINRFPALLTYGRPKLKKSVDFLYEMGLSSENVGKVITRCPHITSYSVEDKLRPTSEYFRSLGIDVASLLSRYPQAFGLSIEANLKPVTEFLLERGYSIDDVGIMATRYGAIYTVSLSGNLVPKWEFFLTMDYPKSELVKFPQYFSYSLEVRIKPRYALVKASGVRLLLNQILSLSDSQFDKLLKKKQEKLANG